MKLCLSCSRRDAGVDFLAYPERFTDRRCGIYNWRECFRQPGVPAAPGAALLFGAGRPLMKAFPPIHRFSLRSHHVVGCQCARRRRGGGLDLQCRVTDVEVVLELARVPACSISSLTDCLSPFPPAAARRLNCGSIARADLESNSQQCKCRALKRFRSCRTGSLHRRQWLCRW